MAEDIPSATLGEIRDGVRATNERLDQTNERLDRRERRQSETAARLATEIVAIAGTVRGLRDVVGEDRELRARIHGHGGRIRALETSAP